MPNILVNRAGAFGDVLFTTPTIRNLKAKYPEVDIYYATYQPHAIQYNPYIHSINKLPNSGCFDLGFNLEYEKESETNCIDVMAKQAGIVLDNKKLDFFLRPPEENIEYKKPYVVINTGKVWKSRQWPLDRFQKVAEYIMQKGIGVVVVGNSNTDLLSFPIKENYNCCSHSSWNTVGNIIQNSLFFFGVDSGPSVVAKALQIPAIIVYGCTEPQSRFADSPELPLFIDSLECSGCRNKTSATFVECKHREVYCITKITVDMAIAQIDKQLKTMRAL